jgi:hypothetical protein
MQIDCLFRPFRGTPSSLLRFNQQMDLSLLVPPNHAGNGSMTAASRDGARRQAPFAQRPPEKTERSRFLYYLRQSGKI